MYAQPSPSLRWRHLVFCIELNIGGETGRQSEIFVSLFFYIYGSFATHSTYGVIKRRCPSIGIFSAATQASGSHKSWLPDPVTLYNITTSHGYRTCHFIQYHHKSWLPDPVTLYNITISHGYRTRHFIQYRHKSWLPDPVTLYNITTSHGYRTCHFIQYHHKSWLPDPVTLYNITISHGYRTRHFIQYRR